MSEPRDIRRTRRVTFGRRRPRAGAKGFRVQSLLEKRQRFLDGSFYYRLPRKTLKEVTYYHWLLRRSRNGTKHKPDGIAVFVRFRPSDACYRDCDVGRD